MTPVAELILNPGSDSNNLGGGSLDNAVHCTSKLRAKRSKLSAKEDF